MDSISLDKALSPSVVDTSSDCTHHLNLQQNEAVTSPPAHILVLAGAGSGKTRVLVSRIAWLVENHALSPFEVLAVTFTNKAAKEMRERLEKLLRIPLNAMWVGTFHSLAHKLLRIHWQSAGLPQTFQILDNDDQYRLIRRVMKDLNLDEEKWPTRQAQWFINTHKESGLRPGQVVADGKIFSQTYQKVYQAYESACTSAGLVDFPELLLRAYEVCERDTDLLAHYHARFKHVMVDEFQDINTIQLKWIKKLTGPATYLMAVGDDDQSIYGWRGARIEHLHLLQQDFADIKTIRLEQNYRSTATILKAANAIISRNAERLGKKLWTDGKVGDKIVLYAAFNDKDEAHFVTSRIKQLHQKGISLGQIAVLYRSNAQSRILEEAFLAENIAYRIYGGLRFFERAEIKDALAYLRLLINSDDDAAFERIVNFPARGIGEVTLSALRNFAQTHGTSLWQAACDIATKSILSTRALSSLKRFTLLIENLRLNTAQLSLTKLTEHVLHKSGLFAHYQKDHSERGLTRIENLEELINATSLFSPKVQAEGNSELSEFLSHIALDAGDYQKEHMSDCVHLMTLHAAKGLEFKVVFITGLEEGLFPHHMSSRSPKALEEERRLCYVGLTRAMRKLYLVYAHNRYLRGKEMHQKASRFISEIPQACIDPINISRRVARPAILPANISAAHTNPVDCPFAIGARVYHHHFGNGVVLAYEGEGAHMRVQVRFKSAGTKWLVLQYAKLQKV